ncbi:hypothetical protein KDA23_01725 [Candidatus Saccharibacteria bacterium]|nr:hypothetical protein [Candidatus Saccharibacteria bacterium]
MGHNIRAGYLAKKDRIGQRGTVEVAVHACYFKYPPSKCLFSNQAGRLKKGAQMVTQVAGKTQHWTLIKMYKHVKHIGPRLSRELSRSSGRPHLATESCAEPVPGSGGVYKSHDVGIWRLKK